MLGNAQAGRGSVIGSLSLDVAAFLLGDKSAVEEVLQVTAILRGQLSGADRPDVHQFNET